MPSKQGKKTRSKRGLFLISRLGIVVFNKKHKNAKIILIEYIKSYFMTRSKHRKEYLKHLWHICIVENKEADEDTSK